MRVAWALLVIATALPAGADVKVKLMGGQMTVEAQNAPLGEILQRISEKTGMKVIWDGPKPQTRIKVTLADRTPFEAVLGVLEGSGINYAVVLDQEGSGVATLLVSTVPTKVRRPPPPPPEHQIVAGGEEAPPPPMPPPLDAGGQPPPQGMPTTAPTAATPQPVTLPTPAPPPASPFTPQGPGPVILNIPGSTPIPPP